MAPIQTHTLITLIERSKDIGNGWRVCSDTVWSLLTAKPLEEPERFELSHATQCVRIKSKPSVSDLMTQIKEWERETKKELESFDRHQAAREMARNLLID